MIILLHSSKTMKLTSPTGLSLTRPSLFPQANVLGEYLTSLSRQQIQAAMKVSDKLASGVLELIASWPNSKNQGSALHSFRGDVFSGLQAPSFSSSDLAYASQHLRIVSGLYGLLRPLDRVAPYRLEMGYKLAPKPYSSLYDFWGDGLAAALPTGRPIINLTSLEYARAIIPFLDKTQVIAPQFFSYNSKTGKNNSVAVHSKIARGAFAHWLVTSQIKKPAELINFSELGYQFSSQLSKPQLPAFVCLEFAGKGLSIRQD